MPPRCLYLALSKHAVRNASRFCLHAHALAVKSLKLDIVTSALVLLCKMRYIFLFTVKTYLCALSKDIIVPYYPFLPVIFC